MGAGRRTNLVSTCAGRFPVSDADCPYLIKDGCFSLVKANARKLSGIAKRIGLE